MHNNKLKKVKKVKPWRGTIDPNMRDYGNDPYFIRKAEQAQKTLEKCNLPEELIKNNK